MAFASGAQQLHEACNLSGGPGAQHHPCRHCIHPVCTPPNLQPVPAAAPLVPNKPQLCLQAIHLLWGEASVVSNPAPYHPQPCCEHWRVAPVASFAMKARPQPHPMRCAVCTNACAASCFSCTSCCPSCSRMPRWRRRPDAAALEGPAAPLVLDDGAGSRCSAQGPTSSLSPDSSWTPCCGSEM